MAADKGEAGTVQAGDAAKQSKKARSAPKKKSQTLAEKTVAEAKAAFKDIDLTEGRSLRKRAAAPSSGPKKSAPKKAAAKKAAPKKAAKAGDETKDAKAAAKAE